MHCFKRDFWRFPTAGLALGLFVLGGVDWIAGALPQPEDPTLYRLEVVWTHGGREKSLKVWNKEQLWASKWVRTFERAPGERAAIKWQGPQLTQLIQESIAGLSLDQKSVIDLIVLYDQSGAAALIPRSFVNRFPLTVALRRGNALIPATGAGPITTIVPWTTRPKARAMNLPVPQYFVNNLVRIELTNLREHFPKEARLKVGADPVLARGENIFLKTCMGCHGTGAWPQVGQLSRQLRTRTFPSEMHQRLPGMPRLRSEDKRGVKAYLDRFKDRSSSPAKSPPFAISGLACLIWRGRLTSGLNDSVSHH